MTYNKYNKFVNNLGTCSHLGGPVSVAEFHPYIPLPDGRFTRPEDGRPYIRLVAIIAYGFIMFWLSFAPAPKKSRLEINRRHSSSACWSSADDVDCERDCWNRVGPAFVTRVIIEWSIPVHAKYAPVVLWRNRQAGAAEDRLASCSTGVDLLRESRITWRRNWLNKNVCSVKLFANRITGLSVSMFLVVD